MKIQVNITWTDTNWVHSRFLCMLQLAVTALLSLLPLTLGDIVVNVRSESDQMPFTSGN